MSADCGNPLQCSCLENPRDGEAWWAAIYGVARVGHDWSDLAAEAADCTHLLTFHSCSTSKWHCRRFPVPSHLLTSLNQWAHCFGPTGKLRHPKFLWQFILQYLFDELFFFFFFFSSETLVLWKLTPPGILCFNSTKLFKAGHCNKKSDCKSIPLSYNSIH